MWHMWERERERERERSLMGRMKDSFYIYIYIYIVNEENTFFLVKKREKDIWVSPILTRHRTVLY